MPEQIVLEAGALEFLPDGKLAVATRRGDIYLVDQPLTETPEDASFTRLASGLHEVLGLAWRDGWLYCVQRCEVTRLKDDERRRPGRPLRNRQRRLGNQRRLPRIRLRLEVRPRRQPLGRALPDRLVHAAKCKYRGWCLRITPDGKVIPTCSGLRSPGGIGANAAGDMFYTDNQGPWNGTCSLKWLRPGTFVGHPGGNQLVRRDRRRRWARDRKSRRAAAA